jgi:hypothetical protein
MGMLSLISMGHKQYFFEKRMYFLRPIADLTGRVAGVKKSAADRQPAAQQQDWNCLRNRCSGGLHLDLAGLIKWLLGQL